MSTEYKTWLAAKAQIREQGDVAEFLFWMIKNPSPMGGLFGRELTKPEINSTAISSTAHNFKGTQVLIRFSETPEASAKWIAEAKGTLVGQAHVATGNETKDAVAIETEHGALMVIPVHNIVDIENV